jgi:hypothetical protein
MARCNHSERLRKALTGCRGINESEGNLDLTGAIRVLSYRGVFSTGFSEVDKIIVPET